MTRHTDDLTTVDAEIAAVEGELHAIRQRYRDAVAAGDFAGQLAIKDAEHLPITLAELRIRRCTIQKRIADADLAALEPERVRLRADLAAADEAVNAAREARRAADIALYRVTARMAACRDRAKAADQRAERIAHEATEQIARDAGAVLTAA